LQTKLALCHLRPRLQGASSREQPPLALQYSTVLVQHQPTLFLTTPLLSNPPPSSRLQGEGIPCLLNSSRRRATPHPATPLPARGYLGPPPPVFITSSHRRSSQAEHGHGAPAAEWRLELTCATSGSRSRARYKFTLRAVLMKAFHGSGVPRLQGPRCSPAQTLL